MHLTIENYDKNENNFKSGINIYIVKEVFKRSVIIYSISFFV